MLLSHRFIALSFALALAPLSIGSPAGAVGFGTFSCITNNDSGDCLIGATQLSATLVASGSDAVLTLTMAGSDAGVVKELFIESSIVSGISFQGSVASGLVAFGTGSSGGNLTGGNTVSFNEAFNIDAANPAPRHGIGRHAQDNVSPQAGAFLLSLTGGSFGELLAELRIGVHVISYASGGSESFVAASIPEPTTSLLLTLGLAGLGVRRRR
jgi:hypothetical protein